MTEKAVSIDEVRALVGERQRYDDWLAALEAKRAETPSRVFDRVHADYSSRRQGVLDQLREHVDTLETLGDSLSTRLAAVDESLAGLEDERLEAMLRTSVGEFDGARWDTLRETVEQSIGEASAQRTSLVAELQDIRALLSSATTSPSMGDVAGLTEMAAGASGAHPESGTEALGVSPPAEPGQPGADLAESAADSDAPTHGSDDESVRGASIASARDGSSDAQNVVRDDASSVVAGAAEQSDAGSDDVIDLADALALFDTDEIDAVAPTAALPMATDAFHDDVEFTVREDVPASNTRQDGATASDRTVTLTPPAGNMPPANGTAPSVDADPFDDLAFLRSVTESGDTFSGGMRSAVPSGSSPVLQQKTLRCTECGTMNLPTEWYCERCGGELAAF